MPRRRDSSRGAMREKITRANREAVEQYPVPKPLTPQVSHKLAPRSWKERKREELQVRAASMRLEGNLNGRWDRSPSGRKSGLFVVRQPGRLTRSPAIDFARSFKIRLEAAMSGRRRPDCLVYDKDGKLIARIDGETRTRTEV